MATDITDKIQEITVTSSVEDMEAGGTLVLAGTDLVDAGTVALDKQIYVSFEYSPNAPALNLRGVVSDIQTKDTPGGDKESVITVMSPFKNYRKQVISTTYFPDATAIKDVLDLLAGTYMGLPAGAYDFTETAGNTLNKFRIDGLTIPDAMRLLADAAGFELGWENGVLTAIDLVGPDVHIDKDRCSFVQIENENDIQFIKAINITGAEMTPDNAPAATTIGTLAIPGGELTEGIDRWYFYVELTKLPAIDITVESDLTTYFDFSYEGLRGNYAVILATRSGAGAQGATNLTVKGRPFKGGKLQRKVVRAAIAGMPDADMEVSYENPFIQDFATANLIGIKLLSRNEFGIKPIKVVLPHNPALNLNDALFIDSTSLVFSVRTIKTVYRVSDSTLEDTITGGIYF